MDDLLVYYAHKQLVKYKHIIVSPRLRGCGHVSIHVSKHSLFADIADVDIYIYTQFFYYKKLTKILS